MKYILLVLMAASFMISGPAVARERKNIRTSRPAASTKKIDHSKHDHDEQGRRIVYKQKNVVNFDSMLLEGEIKNPNEFYFIHRPEEKFGSLVKKRKNFHKEMLRDAVMFP